MKCYMYFRTAIFEMIFSKNFVANLSGVYSMSSREGERSAMTTRKGRKGGSLVYLGSPLFPKS